MFPLKRVKRRTGGPTSNCRGACSAARKDSLITKAIGSFMGKDYLMICARSTENKITFRALKRNFVLLFPPPVFSRTPNNSDRPEGFHYCSPEQCGVRAFFIYSFARYLIINLQRGHVSKGNSVFDRRVFNQGRKLFVRLNIGNTQSVFRQLVQQVNKLRNFFCFVRIHAREIK